MSSEQTNNPRENPGDNQGSFSRLSAFLIVEYNGRKTTIPRNASYQATLASIKKNVRGLEPAPTRQIIIAAYLGEANDHVEITEDVWSDLLPRLTTIRVELNYNDSSNSFDGHTDGSHQHSTPSSSYHARPDSSPGFTRRSGGDGGDGLYE